MVHIFWNVFCIWLFTQKIRDLTVPRTKFREVLKKIQNLAMDGET